MKISSPGNRKKSKELDFMVDSGAYYSFVPKGILKKLQIEPEDTRAFVLANGEIIKRRIGIARFEYGKTCGGAPVVFGEGDDESLLGATALEALGLMLNPIKRVIIPITLRV